MIYSFEYLQWEQYTLQLESMIMNSKHNILFIRFIFSINHSFLQLRIDNMISCHKIKYNHFYIPYIVFKIKLCLYIFKNDNFVLDCY